MSYIVVDGVQKPIYAPKVEIINATEKSIPRCQMTFRLMLEHDTALARWALSPEPAHSRTATNSVRYKWVQLFMVNADGQIQKHWQLYNAFVVSYREIDRPPITPEEGQIGFYYELTVRGATRSITYGRNSMELIAG